MSPLLRGSYSNARPNDGTRFERLAQQLRNFQWSSNPRDRVSPLLMGSSSDARPKDGTRFEKQPQQLGNFSGGLQIQEDVWTSSLLLKGSSSDARPKSSPARSNHGTSFDL